MPEFTGTLRHRVTIEALGAPSQNARGEEIEGWTAEATRWAAIEPLEGHELFTAQQRAADVTHRVTLQFYAGLTAKKRLNFGGRIFNVLSVLNPEEIGKQTQVLAREVV